MGFSGEEPFYGEKGRRGFDRLCQCINSQTVCLSCIAISKTMNFNGVKAHWDITELAERVQELRSRKTEIEAGRTAEKRNKERIDNLRESIDFKAT